MPLGKHQHDGLSRLVAGAAGFTIGRLSAPRPEPVEVHVPVGVPVPVPVPVREPLDLTTVLPDTAFGLLWSSTYLFGGEMEAAGGGRQQKLESAAQSVVNQMVSTYGSMLPPADVFAAIERVMRTMRQYQESQGRHTIQPH